MICRNLFLKSVLRQDIGWYDVHQTGEFASRISEDLMKLQEGIGEKIGARQITLARKSSLKYYPVIESIMLLSLAFQKTMLMVKSNCILVKSFSA